MVRAEEVRLECCGRGRRSFLLLLLWLLAFPGPRVPGPCEIPVSHQRGMQGLEEGRQAIADRAVLVLRVTQHVVKVADPDNAQPGPVLPGEGLSTSICEQPVAE